MPGMLSNRSLFAAGIRASITASIRPIQPGGRRQVVLRRWSRPLWRYVHKQVSHRPLDSLASRDRTFIQGTRQCTGDADWATGTDDTPDTGLVTYAASADIHENTDANIQVMCVP
jgi:hypothetical protein